MSRDVTFRVVLAGDKKSLNRAFVGAQRDLNRWEKQAGRAFAAVGAAAGAAGAAIAAKAIGAAASFRKEMAEVRTLMPGVSDAVFGQLGEDVRELSREMGFVAGTTVPALYDAISAGVPPDNAIAFLETASKTAIGGVSDLATATDALTTITNTWGKSAGTTAAQGADILFTAVRLGKTTIDEIGGSLNQVAGLASSFSIGIEDVAAGFTKLTTEGAPTGEAMTKMRALIQSLAAPTKRAAATLDELGIQTGAARLAQEGFLPVIQEIMAATEGNEAAQRQLFGSVEALQAALSIAAGGGQGYAETLHAMRNAAGATDAAFETMSETVAHQWAKAQAELSDALIELGTRLLPAATKAMRGAVQAGRWLAENWEKLVPLAGALGAAVAGIAVAKLAAALKSFLLVAKVGGLMAMMSPAGWLILGLAAAAAATLLLAEHWDLVEEKLRDFIATWTPIGITLEMMGVQVRKTAENSERLVDEVGEFAAKSIRAADSAFKAHHDRIKAMHYAGTQSAKNFEAAHAAAARTTEAEWELAYAAVKSDAVAAAEVQIAAAKEVAEAVMAARALIAAGDKAGGGLDSDAFRRYANRKRIDEAFSAAGLPHAASGLRPRASAAGRGPDSGGGAQPVEVVGQPAAQLDLLQTIADWGDKTHAEALRLAETQLAALTAMADSDGRRTIAEQALIDSARTQADTLAKAVHAAAETVTIAVESSGGHIVTAVEALSSLNAGLADAASGLTLEDAVAATADYYARQQASFRFRESSGGAAISVGEQRSLNQLRQFAGGLFAAFGREGPDFDLLLKARAGRLDRRRTAELADYLGAAELRFADGSTAAGRTHQSLHGVDPSAPGRYAPGRTGSIGGIAVDAQQQATTDAISSMHADIADKLDGLAGPQTVELIIDGRVLGQFTVSQINTAIARGDIRTTIGA